MRWINNVWSWKISGPSGEEKLGHLPHKIENLLTGIQLLVHMCARIIVKYSSTQWLVPILLSLHAKVQFPMIAGRIWVNRSRFKHWWSQLQFNVLVPPNIFCGTEYLHGLRTLLLSLFSSTFCHSPAMPMAAEVVFWGRFFFCFPQTRVFLNS